MINSDGHNEEEKRNFDSGKVLLEEADEPIGG